MVDTTGTIVVKDGLAVTRNLGTMVDGVVPTTQYPQYQPRIAGAPVSAVNPAPVTDAAAEASLGTIATQDTAIAAASGTQADAAWSGTGNSTIIAALKAVFGGLGVGNAQATLSAAALGTPADTAWTGSGTSTNVAALKAIWTKLGAVVGSVTLSGALPAGANLIGAILPAIGTAIDFSANAASLGGLNLLTTLAADSTRAGGYLVQNQSAVTLTVALDDGAGGVQSIFLLAPGSGAGTQGGSASADWGIHRGRIRIYGLAGSQVAARAW